MLTVKEQKAQLRHELLARRDALSAAERSERSRLIAQRVLDRPLLAHAEFVLAFASFRSEVLTDELLRELLARGKRLLLPRIRRGTRQLDLHVVADLERDLEPGLYDIREPIPARCPKVEPDAVEFIVIPGVGFDERGHRLGYGGGYYDNLLRGLDGARWPEHMVALAFELQIVPNVPVKPRDVPVPYIATEQRLIDAL
jgi:5-formyltetrahydrofolate cyclo-ligase